MNKVFGKLAGLLIPYLLFSLMMLTSRQSYGSGAAISVALKRLSLGMGEQYGIVTLLVVGFIADSSTSRLFKGL